MITKQERDFVWSWCRTRNLDDVYTVLALTLWVRAKPRVCPHDRDITANFIYMVSCIHLALKYLGYDEIARCNFFADIKQINTQYTFKKHQQVELTLLRALEWKFESL